MKIEHAAGTSVETNTLPDVDALLMEESMKLHTLFAKYNRQLFLVGEMIGTNGLSANQGCIFFHIAPIGTQSDPDVLNKAINAYYSRIDGYIRGLSQHTIGLGRIPPPTVEPQG